MGFLAGKRVLIVGVASKLSIASGIAARALSLPSLIRTTNSRVVSKNSHRAGVRALSCASRATWPAMRKSPRSSKS